MPVRKLAGLLGISRSGLGETADMLEQFGVIESHWIGTERYLKLNRKFPAYNALKTLAIRMDKDFGRQFEAIARSHKKRAGIAAIRRYWAKWAGRKMTDRPWLKHQ